MKHRDLPACLVLEDRCLQCTCQPVQESRMPFLESLAQAAWRMEAGCANSHCTRQMGICKLVQCCQEWYKQTAPHLDSPLPGKHHLPA